jgi:BASS family bile acid:Na+ symporter
MFQDFLDNYPRYEYLLAQIQLVLFTLGMGATLTAADFVRIAQQPRALVVGALGQFLFSPFLAVLVNRWFGVPPGIAVGLILIAVMPGGAMSKLFTYLGKGNVALSITLTACGTLASLVTVPVLLRLLAYEYIPSEFRMPVWEIVVSLLAFLLLPLGAGMAVARFFPVGRKPFSRWCVRIGFVFVIAMVSGSLLSGRIEPGSYGWSAALAIIVWCVLSMQLCMLPMRVLGWPKADCLSVGIEVTMRNLNLALALKPLLFPAGHGEDPIADGVLFVILFYSGVAMGAGTPLALNFRRMIRKEQLKKQQEIDPVAADLK